MDSPVAVFGTEKEKSQASQSYPVTLCNKKVTGAFAPVTSVSLTVQSLAGFIRPPAEVCGDNSSLRCPVDGIEGSLLPRRHLLSGRIELKDELQYSHPSEF